MKIYLDTNILLDFFMESRSAHLDSIMVLQMADKGYVETVLSTQSIIDAAYVYCAQGKVPLSRFKEVLRALLSIVSVTQIDEHNIKSALRSANDDFEDAAQLDCAVTAGCEAIISCDKKMKQASALPVYTAKEFCDLAFTE